MMRAIHTVHTAPLAHPSMQAPGRDGERTAALASRLAWPLALFALAGACTGVPDGRPDADPADAAAAAPNTLTEAERAAGWRLLFDGETTAGWRGYNRDAFPDTGWAVIDGMLVVGATSTDPDVAVGGDIVTTESFTDFDLKFEFMLSDVANSGVLYRVIEEPGAEIWHNAPEYQVLDDPRTSRWARWT